MKVRLTKEAVARATAPPGRRSLYLWDTDVKGLGLRVRGKTKSYVLRYGTGRRGKGRTPTIGRHNQPWRPDPITGEGRRLNLELAREEAIRLLGMKVDRKDPAAARDAALAIPTIEEFAPTYLTDWAELEKAPSSVVKDRGYLDGHIVPKLGPMRMDLVGPQHVTALKKALRDKPVTFNRCLALLHHMFKMARRWGRLPAGHPNPCEDMPRYEERGRERPLSIAELGRAGRALAELEAMARKPRAERPKKADKVPPRQAAAIRTLILTGARPCEILPLLRTQLPAALAAGVIEQESRKVGRRRRRRRPVLLNAFAVEVLKNVETVPGNPFVFAGRLKGRPLSVAALDDSWELVRKRAGLEDVRLYDAARHTFGTEAAGSELLKHVQDLLGHSSSSTTEKYIHLPPDPLRAANERVGRRLADALAAKE